MPEPTHDIDTTCPHCGKPISLDLQPLDEERFTLVPAPSVAPPEPAADLVVWDGMPPIDVDDEILES